MMTDFTDQPKSRPQSRETTGDFPVFNRGTFDGTAAFLKSDAIVLYLSTIADRGAMLQVKLRLPDALQTAAAEVAEEAHTLAGSAGMFGFDQLAEAARSLEHAIQVSRSNAVALVTDLDGAILTANDIILNLVEAIDTFASKPCMGAHSFELVRSMELPT